MAREAGRAITRQQVIDLLAILGIDEDEISAVRHVEIDPRSVRVTRCIRGESGGTLMGADGRIAEHVEVMPIDWRERTETVVVGEPGPELTL